MRAEGKGCPIFLATRTQNRALVKLSWDKDNEEEGHGSNATDSHCCYKILVGFLEYAISSFFVYLKDYLQRLYIFLNSFHISGYFAEEWVCRAPHAVFSKEPSRPIFLPSFFVTYIPFFFLNIFIVHLLLSGSIILTRLW